MGAEKLKRLESIDEIVDTYFASSSSTRSKIYVTVGLIFVMFAIIGIWLSLIHI